VHKHMRKVAAVGAAVVLALAAAACGSSSSGSSSSSGAAKNGGTITIAAGTPPLSADQGLDFTTQGTELYSVVATPLMTFKRGVQGVGGTQILPGLAKAAPTVSNGGLTYTFMLRKGLKYSNGKPVLASDETHARAVKGQYLGQFPPDAAGSSSHDGYLIGEIIRHRRRGSYIRYIDRFDFRRCRRHGRRCLSLSLTPPERARAIPLWPRGILVLTLRLGSPSAGWHNA